MRPEKEEQQIKKPSAFETETKNLDLNNKERSKLMDEGQRSLNMAEQLVELGEAYLDKKAAEKGALKIRLKKDNSVIFYSDEKNDETERRSES